MTAPEVIAGICRDFGPQLTLPAGSPLVPDRVLWALAGCESDFGMYALPRHEPAYCYGHRYDVPSLSKRYGCLAHCSYGPWQMMYPHLVTYGGPENPADFVFVAQPGDVSDQQFDARARRCAKIAVAMLNAEIFGRQRAMTLAEVAKAWNHGVWADDFDDDDYVNRARKFYAEPYPLEAK